MPLNFNEYNQTEEWAICREGRAENVLVSKSVLGEIGLNDGSVIERVN